MLLINIDPMARMYFDHIEIIPCYIQEKKKKVYTLHRDHLTDLLNLLRQSLMLDAWMHDCWEEDIQFQGGKPSDFRLSINNSIDYCLRIKKSYPKTKIFYLSYEQKSLFG